MRVLVFITWLLSIAFTIWLAGRKRRSVIWAAVIGILFGWIGLIIYALLPSRAAGSRCPHCGSTIRHPEATVCAHCRRDLIPPTASSD